MLMGYFLRYYKRNKTVVIFWHCVVTAANKKQNNIIKRIISLLFQPFSKMGMRETDLMAVKKATHFSWDITISLQNCITHINSLNHLLLKWEHHSFVTKFCAQNCFVCFSLKCRHWQMYMVTAIWIWNVVVMTFCLHWGTNCTNCG